MSELVTENIDYIRALGRLYEFCSNKKFHLISNDFINDNIGNTALEINNKIKNQTGIDLFNAREDKDLYTYENILNRFTTQFSNEHFGQVELGDEVDLLRLGIPFSPQNLNKLNIEVIDWLKPVLKKVSIAIPTLITICKTADAVTYVEEDLSFYLIKKIKIGAKEKIFFAHLTYYDEKSKIPAIRKIRGKSLSSYTGGFLNKEALSDALQVRMIFAFDYKEFYYLNHDPIRFFIKALDIYGLNLEINKIMKRYFRNLILPAYVKEPMEFYSIINQPKGISRTVSMSTNSNIAFTLIFIYCIDIDTYLKDFKNGNI